MEEKNKIPKKPRFTNTWKLITVVISLLIIYTVYHVFFGLAESVKTTPAGLVEQSSSVILEGVIYRDEECISVKNKGDMRPYYYDGERVSVDSAVASVYTQSGNESANGKIAELEEKLDILKKSNVKGLVSIVDIEKIKGDIENLYTSMKRAQSDGDMLRAHRAEKEYLIAVNKLKIYEGKIKNYDSEIAEIELELDVLYNSFKGDREYIFADKGGYFYHSCDGYEYILTEDSLNSLNPTDLKKTTAQVKEDPKIDNSYRCKFVYSNVWRVATVCDNETAALLKEGEEYSVILFDIRQRELAFTLERIGASDESGTILVFSCATMPEDFDYTRYQSFRLDISSIEGYRVPKEALIKGNDGQNGVYILNASVVYFRRVDIIGESDGYYIVAKQDRSQDNYYEYLALNDLIILDTRGIYDGQVLTR